MGELMWMLEQPGGAAAAVIFFFFLLFFSLKLAKLFLCTETCLYL